MRTVEPVKLLLNRHLPLGTYQYGAPMGRRDWNSPTPESDTFKVRLVEVPISLGGYDQGGAYWGRDPRQRLYLAVWRDPDDDEEFRMFVRGKDRPAAKVEIRNIHHNATFYR